MSREVCGICWCLYDDVTGACGCEPEQEQVWVCPDSAEHRYQKPGHCEDCGKTLVQVAEPLQKPVAWIHTDPDKPGVRFLEWQEDEPGYRGRWIKTPLFIAPLGCPNCASMQDQNTELDQKLAEMERKLLELQAAIFRSQGIGN